MFFVQAKHGHRGLVTSEIGVLRGQHEGRAIEKGKGLLAAIMKEAMRSLHQLILFIYKGNSMGNCVNDEEVGENGNLSPLVQVIYDWAADHAVQLKIINQKLADDKADSYWEPFDLSKGGLLDTKEAEYGVKKVLKLPELFELQDVIKWAYKKAKTALPPDTKVGDSVVSRKEFPFFIRYLREYANFWFFYHQMNSKRVGTMRRQVFLKNAAMLKTKGIPVKNAVSVYNRIDTDEKGFIFFHELYRFMLQKGVDFAKVEEPMEKQMGRTSSPRKITVK